MLNEEVEGVETSLQMLAFRDLSGDQTREQFSLDPEATYFSGFHASVLKVIGYASPHYRLLDLVALLPTRCLVHIHFILFSGCMSFHIWNISFGVQLLVLVLNFAS